MEHVVAVTVGLYVRLEAKTGREEEDESGRQAHLAGQVASALKEKGPQLLASEPTIERFDVLGAKVPVVAPQGQ